GDRIALWPTLLPTAPGKVTTGGTVSIGTAIVRYCGVGACATIAAFAACAFVSAGVMLTLAAGAAGAGGSRGRVVPAPRVSPVSIVSLSPAARPVVLARRIAVAPAAEAALSVVLAAAGVTPLATLPAASSAR